MGSLKNCDFWVTSNHHLRTLGRLKNRVFWVTSDNPLRTLGPLLGDHLVTMVVHINLWGAM